MKILNKIQSMAIQVVRLPDGSYEASIPQLARSVVGYGDSSEAALADMLQVAEATAHFLEEQGEDLPDPEPVPEWTDYSGRVTLRLPKMLHAQLDRLATREGVSLNSLLTTILQAGATSLAAGCEFGVAAEPSDLVVLAEIRALREDYFELSARRPEGALEPARRASWFNDPASGRGAKLPVNWEMIVNSA
ncbi:MAG: toxin-antitoxin system HicB family antitoxin [Armatimonadetes bacterium]|nr:toxin-antitoxin system HicB family antitoxin [Armatimonadota bacterium]NOG39890.1 toxin-antitoxin system HicB family antitoxin [Armatimonadota bacterium]GIK31403.1 MAG: hypothetical protein BroJett009_03950 [Armatimonadota bacterium]